MTRTARLPEGSVADAVSPEMNGDAFRSFLEAEMRAMLGSMNKRDRVDSDRCNARALDWVARNAAQFRKAWYEALGLCGESPSSAMSARKGRRNA